MPRWLLNRLMFLQTGLRGVAVGVRVLVFNAGGAVLLVRHSYMKGWYLPGGGVERGENPLDAACREAREEAGIKVVRPPRLLSFYLNDRPPVPDYVALYLIDHDSWHWAGADRRPPDYPSPDGEIVEAGFFPVDALPDGITPATRRRIEGYFHGEQPGVLW